MSNAESQIADSLRRLLQRSTDVHDCFVIVEEPASDKLVQFAGSTDEPLLLDLPIPATSREARARAQQLFSNVPGSNETEIGFSVSFDRNADDAAKLAMRVFREVYLFGENVELKLTEK